MAARPPAEAHPESAGIEEPSERAPGTERPWTEEVDAFLDEKRRESPVGEAWLRRMRWELGRLPGLLARADPQRVPASASAVDAEHVRGLRRVLPWEKATFVVHFAAVRQFLDWAGNPIGRKRGVWRLPSGQPSHRRWLTRAQFGRLLEAAEGRAALLVALEGLNGLRRVEVLRLREKDLLFSEGSLRVLGKGRDGGKWRQIPMHPTVRRYLERRRGSADGEARLFPISASGADALLQRAAQRAGFPRDGLRVSHHDLRRTFGRLAHAAGMDLVQLKNLYGHASLEMTVHYIGLDADEMREGLERLRVGRPRRRARAFRRQALKRRRR